MKINRNTAIISASIIGILLVVAINATTVIRVPEQLTEKNSLPVYFVKGIGENDYKLTIVRRKIYKDESNITIAVHELLKGPNNNEKRLGYFSEVPKGTKILEINETPERIIVNLSKELEIGGGSATITMRAKQLVNTILDSAGQKPVYLQVEGESLNYLGGEGIIIPQPLSRNLNKGQDI